MVKTFGDRVPRGARCGCTAGQSADAIGCSELYKDGAQLRLPSDFHHPLSKIDCYEFSITRYMTEKHKL